MIRNLWIYVLPEHNNICIDGFRLANVRIDRKAIASIVIPGLISIYHCFEMKHASTVNGICQNFKEINKSGLISIR